MMFTLINQFKNIDITEQYLSQLSLEMTHLSWHEGIFCVILAILQDEEEVRLGLAEALQWPACSR